MLLPHESTVAHEQRFVVEGAMQNSRGAVSATFDITDFKIKTKPKVRKKTSKCVFTHKYSFNQLFVEFVPDLQFLHSFIKFIWLINHSL